MLPFAMVNGSYTAGCAHSYKPWISVILNSIRSKNTKETFLTLYLIEKNKPVIPLDVSIAQVKFIHT